MSDIKDVFLAIFKDIKDVTPTVLKFIGFVIFAWIFIKILIKIIRKVLSKTNIDEWSNKLSETEIFGSTTINVMFTNVILGVLKWFLILIFVMAGAGIFGMDSVSNGISGFFAYLPRLLTSLAIFVAGAYLGTIVKKAIISMFKSLEISGGNLLGNIAFYLIVIFLSITALDQAGIDTSVIKQNLTLIIASVLIAFTIAFGLGSKSSVERLLFGYYSRKNLQIGQNIRLNGLEGIIESIDNISMVLKTSEGKIVLPIKEVVDNKIEILN